MAPVSKLSSTARGYGYTYRKLRPVVMDRDGHQCQIRGPGCTGKATDVDHVIPGGPNDLSNLRAACSPCNQARRRRPARSGGPSAALASSSVRW